jgi:SAM-dependent methyltransferase
MNAYETYAAQEAARPPRYRGQLQPGLQAALAAHYAEVAEADCKFVHSMDLPEGRAVHGVIDLRGIEDAYLGKIKLWGKRVLEIAPGSGGLSVWLAARAGELVVFDSAHPSAVNAATRRGWWFVKNRLGYEAQAVYGDPNAPPDDLGHFDIAVCAGLFSRGGHPELALQQLATLADTLIIAEPITPAVAKLGETPTASFGPASEAGGDSRWHFSPAAVVAMVAAAGFGDVTISGSAARDSAGNVLAHYTLVARRSAVTKIAVAGADMAMPKVPVAPPPIPAAPPPPIADDEPEPDDVLPLPTADGRFSVAGTDDVEVFVVLGRAGYKALKGSLRRAGIETSSLGRVLDFGCGVGRVLRYWHAHPDVELHGTDLNPQSIAWSQENLGFARFKTNSIEPVLDYPDGYFGLVYALSVFTHLPEPMQAPWLAEVLRIIRPGGLLYFTTHGDSYRRMLEPDLQVKFDRDELIVGGVDDPGSNYCGAFHPPNYVKQQLLKPFGLELLEFLPEGAAGNPTQDSWLVRKP